MKIIQETTLEVRILEHSDDDFGVDITTPNGELLHGNCGYDTPQEALNAILTVIQKDSDLLFKE